MLSVGDVRAVIDTNVLLSGLLWRGPPHRLIEEVRAGGAHGDHQPGLARRTRRGHPPPQVPDDPGPLRTNPERMLAELRRFAEIVEPPSLPAQVSRDPDDDAVLALAVTTQADLIISGDADLLILGAPCRYFDRRSRRCHRPAQWQLSAAEALAMKLRSRGWPLLADGSVYCRTVMRLRPAGRPGGHWAVLRALRARPRPSRPALNRTRATGSGTGVVPDHIDRECIGTPGVNVSSHGKTETGER